MGMEKGDVLGHEPMGIVGEVGSSVAKLKEGDRIVVPFVIACGHCFFCTNQLLFMQRHDQPGRRESKQTNGTRAGGTFRLFTFARPPWPLRSGS
jgi:threonine dehydrogenase-like Zn-dependent dehydrogenase